MTNIAKWFVLVPLFIIPFLPLYVANDLFFPFIASKGFAFRILVGIAFGAWVALALANKQYRPRFSWTLLIYGVFVAWMLLADLLAPNAHKALWSNYERMDGWVTMVHVFLFFIVASSVLTVHKLWKRWWLTFAGASALIAGYGVLQLMGVLAIHQGGVRLDASFGNAAYLAAYLLSAVAIAVWQGMESRGWLRYALFALAGVHALLLLATATRGAILALVGAAVLAAALFALTHTAARRAGAIALVGLVVLIGGFFLIKDASFIQQDPTLTRIANISVADGDTRFLLWGMAWEGFLERPITGWGHEGFNLVFAKHYDPALFEQEPWFDRAHSVYVDWLMAGGLPALLLFLSLLVSAVVGLWRSSASLSERILLTSAVAAYAFQALFVFDNLFTYIVLAAFLAMAHAERSRPFARLEEAPVVSLNIAAPIIIIVTGLSLWVVNVPGITGGQRMLNAFGSTDAGQAYFHFTQALESGSFATQEIREQFLVSAATIARQPAVANELKQEALSRALQEMQQEVIRSPLDPRLRVQFATGLEAGGLYAEALKELDTAIALSPNKQTTYLQRGVTKWRMGDTAGTRADFEAAYALSQEFDGLAAYVVAGKILSGDTAGARTFLNERFEGGAADNDFLRAVLYEAGMFPELIASAELHKRNNPDTPNAYAVLAQAYALSGRMAEAQTQVQEMITRFPETAASGAQLLEALRQQKK